MIRQKHLLTFIALLVFSAMTFNDTQFIFIDHEEWIEAREVEKEEEVKEGEESEKSELKYLFSGGSDFISSSWHPEFSNYWQVLRDGKSLNALDFTHTKVPLFIMYCALKLHLS